VANKDFESSSEDTFPVSIATLPITPRQRNVAIGLVSFLFAGILILAPFAALPLARLEAFIPVLQTVLCVFELTTAVLLLGQYAVRPAPAFLALASGYMASGLFAFAQTLAFPGAYAPGGLIGDGLNTPAWIFVLWHTTFPLAVIIYALTKDVYIDTGARGYSAAAPIGAAVGCTLATVVILVWGVSVGASHLPSLYVQDFIQQAFLARLVNMLMWSLGATALVVLYLRRRTILDLWVIVALVAWMPNFLVAAFTTSVRFSLGWYAARVCALLASCVVLVVLLSETTLLYARLASAFTLTRRERTARIMSVDVATAAIAHEIRQPLSSIASSTAAALNWLKKTPPDLDEALTALRYAAEQTHRADEIIVGVRQLANKRGVERRTTQLNHVVRQALQLLEQDLLNNDVSAAFEAQENLPPLQADPTLLQQVILNLVKNAIDAMHSVAGSRHLAIATRLEGGSAVVSVQDTGRGITQEDRKQIFEPFFTTKHAGMGLGLAICQTIVEEHGGRLRLAQTSPQGTTFEIALPVSPGV